MGGKKGGKRGGGGGGGGKGRKGGGKGGKGGKKGGKKGPRRTRDEKVARHNARLEDVLAKQQKKEMDEISSSSSEASLDPLEAERKDEYADLLQSFGVEQKTANDELADEMSDEEEEEDEELEEIPEADSLADLNLDDLSPEELAALEEMEELEEEEELEEGEDADDDASGDIANYQIDPDDDDDDDAEPPSKKRKLDDTAATVTSHLDTPWYNAQFTRDEPAESRAKAATLRKAAWSALAPTVATTAGSVAGPGGKVSDAVAGFMTPAPGQKGRCPKAVERDVWERCRVVRHSEDSTTSEKVSNTARALFTAQETYADVVYPLRTWDNAAAVIEATTLHAYLHVLRGNDRVYKHNAEVNSGKVDLDQVDDESYRDQGFLQPKVLVLLPMRNLCLEYIECLARLWGGDEDAIGNWTRFQDDFRPLPHEEDKKFHRRTQDYKQQFAGNINDQFCFGVSISRQKMHIFSTFNKSDILFASPLGLAATLKKNQKQGADFLSSIDVMVADQVDCLAMQNFDFTLQAFDQVNQLPENMSDCADINRIRSYLLDQQGAVYRQTVLVSRVHTAEMNALANRFRNHRGVIKCGRNYNGELTRVVNQAKHLFQRIEVSSVKASPEERFRFFEQKVFSRLATGMNSGVGKMSTLIVVPSYFDFTRLRNFFEQVDRDSFVELCEYTPVIEMHRAIKEFNDRKRSFLIMTERFYYFRRYVLSSVKSIIFYQLPMSTWFYHELVNTIPMDQSPSILTLYSKYDTHELTRVLGTERTRKVLASEGSTHMFC